MPTKAAFNLNKMFYCNVFVLNIIYSCDAKLSFQQKKNPVQYHMILKNYSLDIIDMLILSSRNIYFIIKMADNNFEL